MSLAFPRAASARSQVAGPDGFRAGFRRRRELRKAYLQTRGELARMSDRDLADIGIARADIRNMALQAVHGR